MNNKGSLLLSGVALLAGLCSSHCSQSANGAGDLEVADLGVADLVPLPPGPGLTAVTPNLIRSVAGIPLVIEGANFAAGATVTIGGELATQTVVVSATRITTVTPLSQFSSGSVPVVVTNPNGQLVSRSDLLTFYALLAGTGQQPIDVAVGDFNGDGNADIATVNRIGASVSVLFGDGRANFAISAEVPLGGFGSELAAADFNRDGITDIAVLSLDYKNGATNADLLLGSRAGRLKTTSIWQDTQAANSWFSMGIGDWNNDGLMDVDFSAYGGNAIRIADGSGKFVVNANMCGQGGSTFWVATGDLNGDGKADFVTEDLGSFAACIGDGAGKFTRRLPNAGHINARTTNSARMVDLNGDRRDDLIFVGGGSISIFFNDGMGGLLPALNIPVRGNVAKLAVVDLNGDGKLDLAVPEIYPNKALHILLGDGAGKFVEDQVLTLGQYPWAIAAGDFDGDKKPDLVITNVAYSGNGSSYGLNTYNYDYGFGAGGSVSIVLNPY